MEKEKDNRYDYHVVRNIDMLWSYDDIDDDNIKSQQLTT